MSHKEIEEETEKVAEHRRRLKEFEDKPENFIHVDEIVIAAVRMEKRIVIFTGAVNRTEMEIALTRVNYKVMQMFTEMDMTALLKKKQNEIVTPPNSGKIII